MSDWNLKPRTKSIEEIPDHWLKGYFRESHENWDGETWYRNLHELRTRDIALMALGDVRGRKILDVGCGDGSYCYMLAKLGGIVSGQDINHEKIAKANARLYGPNGILKGNFSCADARTLSFQSNYFDCVFSADFIEHIDMDTKLNVFSEIYRVLKPGGIVVIKTPNLGYLKLSILIKRLIAVMRLRSPFIAIPHTDNNPDNEHHGLIDFTSLKKILANYYFHEPSFHYQPLIRRGIPGCVSRIVAKLKIKTLNEHIIISLRKSIFVDISD